MISPIQLIALVLVIAFSVVVVCSLTLP